jgi:hypothetical protein
MSNSGGSGNPTTPERTMAAYDKLPPTARRALQDAWFCWSTQPILTRWRKGVSGFKTGAEIARLIELWDRLEHLKDVKRGRVAP